MKQQVAVKRHTSRGAPRIDGDRRVAPRPSGRRFLLLGVLACAGVIALGAGAAQSLAAGLPDSRAYELVSPAVKGGEVEHLVIIAGDQAAPDGNSLGYIALSPLSSNGMGIDELATRGPNGWTSRDTLPPEAPGVTLSLPAYSLYSTDLSKGLIALGGATLSGAIGSGLPVPGPGNVHDAAVPEPTRPSKRGDTMLGRGVGQPQRLRGQYR